MYIVEYQYKLKAEADINEQLRLLTDVAAPVYRRIPGCISANVFEYKDSDDKKHEWEYVFVVVWESEEAANSCC